MVEPSPRSHQTAPPGDVAIRCSLVAPSRASAASAEVRGLIDLVVSRYHDTHRREFPKAIALARKVEAAHAGHSDCPRGLADLLALMIEDLESHQQREEQVLFPMILGGGSRMIRFPIGRMMAEHAEVEEQLVRLRGLTRGFAAPAGACATWRSLMSACRKLDLDLREHMRLENEVLFAPFLD